MADDEGECFNMLLSLCFPPSVEHGGVWRLKPALKKCKCLFDSPQNTLTIEMESPSTQQEVTSVIHMWTSVYVCVAMFPCVDLCLVCLL